MGGGRRRGRAAGGAEARRGVGEAARLTLTVQLRRLAESDSAELTLPSSLSIEERAYVHEQAAKLGLRTKSRGGGGKRFVTVYKRSESTLVQKDASFELDRQSRRAVAELIETYPITGKEKEELGAAAERERPAQSPSSSSAPAPPAPQVPASQCPPEVLAFKRGLPIDAHRQDVVRLIEDNQVSIVVAETGSGKTTQIPQFILEECQREKRKCRLVCTQPRRISAVSVSERVAFERGEKVGNSIGYQIRSESRISAKTVLTYCTNGVLLRMLMGGGSALSAVTHVLIDEIHERDKFADFLLISLKDALPKHKDLKIILMSATIEASLFSKYFDGCPVLTVPGKIFEVQKLHLEDILPMIDYKTEAMKKIKQRQPKKKEGEGEVSDPSPPTKEVIPVEAVDPSLQADVDEFLNDCLTSGSPDSFGQILYMYISDDVPIDCAHSETGMTGLMVAAYHGYMDTIEEIIKMGGNVSIVDKSGKQAYDYAHARGHSDCAEYLKSLAGSVSIPVVVPQNNDGNDLLDLYLQSMPDETTDLDLILSIVKHIHLKMPKGSILVFLTGYDDITSLRDSILSCADIKHGTYQLFTLHSNMQTVDQKKVFGRSPILRKIILSTNIAETSVTIDDVVYVVDCGKVKEMTFECMTGVSSLQRCWISKASALQRAGRAGRTQPGKSFMVYSKRRYESFADQSQAEILRVPLHELCLHSKLLAPFGTPIADYLAKAIEPPSILSVKNSVALLKTIGALTPTEEITEIGQHLLGLSIEPKYGKMILYACVLKCLDPVLTIACSLATKEPFQINPNKNSKKTTQDLRKEFSADTLSDHMTLLRAFQSWQIARANKNDKIFCEKNLISKATMEMILSFRTQILAQLRSIGFIKARGASDIKDVNQNSDKWCVVKAALVAGLYPSIARIDKEEYTLRSSKEATLAFHPRSALHTGRGKSGLKQSLNKVPSEWIAYEEIIRIGRACFISCNSVVTPLTVALFGGPLRLSSTAIKMNLPGMSDDSDSDQDDDSAHMETGCLALDDWISFIAIPHDALSVYFLRQKFCALLIRKMLHPSRTFGQMDDKIVSTIVQILCADELRFGLGQPIGIGLRPKSNIYDGQNVRQNNDYGENRSSGSSFYNHPGMANSFGQHKGNHYMKLGKQGNMYQNSNKGPLSPNSGNILLANIEKYTNSHPENTAVMRNCRYFIVRAVDPSIIENSQANGMWNFTKSTLQKLSSIAEMGSKVIIFFSIGEAISRFYGFAEFLNSGSTTDNFINQVKWISTQSIPHHLTRSMVNSLNDNRRIFASADGQEISMENGKALMMLLEQGKKNRNNGRPIQKQTN